MTVYRLMGGIGFQSYNGQSVLAGVRLKSDEGRPLTILARSARFQDRNFNRNDGVDLHGAVGF